MHIKLYIFATIIMAVSLCPPVHAQNVASGNIARIVFQEEIEPDAEPLVGIEQALNALRKETRQLRSTTKQESINPLPDKPSPFPTQRPSIEPVLEDLRSSEIEDNSLGDIGNTDDIVERIELLKRIYRNKRIEKEKREKEALLKAQTPPEKTQPPITNSSTAELPVPDNAVPATMQQNTIEPAKTVEPPTPLVNVNRVFQDPVDTFEMGNSLYQNGEVQTALEAYVQIDKSSLTASEIVWLDFMVASCYRRLGNEEEAIALYRDVVNQSEVPNLVKPAGSWIRQLEQMSQARSAIEQIESDMESFLKQAESNVKQ